MASDANGRLVGNGSYIVFNGTAIPITSYTVTSDRTMTDKTNSTHYNPSTGMFCPAQVPVSVVTKVQVEGRFRINVVPNALISLLYQDVEDVYVLLGLDSGNQFGEGRFDITDFRTTVPINDVVTYSCALLSNGPFNPFS